MAVLNDEDLEREELVRQLEGPDRETRARRRGQPYEQGGVTGAPGGYQSPDAPLPEVMPVDVMQTPTQTAIAPRFPVPGTAPGDKANAARPNYAVRGFDAGKMASPYADQSERYKIGNVMQKYDPKGGVTPEMLAELNALGIAEFSGSGGNLTVNNTHNDPRFGSGGTGDVVYAYDAQNGDTAWQPWFVDNGAAAAPAASGGNGMSGGGGGSSFMNTLVPQDNEFFQQLQAKAQELLGGAGAMDREALLRMLGVR